MKDGAYSAWDCLNSTYRVSEIAYERFEFPERSFIYAVLELEGAYDMEKVAALYAELPEVTRTEVPTVNADGPTICLTTGAESWHYAFDQAGGDCLLGCTTHEYHHFVTTADGALEALETWVYDYPANAPDWVHEYASPEACR